jgi:hypothetical protein
MKRVAYRPGVRSVVALLYQEFVAIRKETKKKEEKV